MRYLVLGAATAIILGITFPGMAGEAAGREQVRSSETFEHGGGCRKNSRPGQCCHMNNGTGYVHCH